MHQITPNSVFNHFYKKHVKSNNRLNNPNAYKLIEKSNHKSTGETEVRHTLNVNTNIIFIYVEKGPNYN